MRKFLTLPIWLAAAVAAMVLSTPVVAHNYFASFFYLSGVYSPTDEPLSYSRASDAEMKWLLEQIESKDKNIRAIAAGALGQSGRPEAAEPLLKALSDEDPLVRMNATMAFTHIKDPRAIVPLKKKLNVEHEELDTIGAYYAFVAQGEECIDALIALEGDQDREEPPFAGVAEAITTTKGLGSISWAADVLRGPNEKYYPVAITVLSFFDQEENRARLEPVLSDKQIFEKLVSIAQDKKCKYRRYTLALLNDSKDPRVVSLVKQDDKDHEDDIQRQVAGANPEPGRLSAKQIKQYAAEVRRAKGEIDHIDCLDAVEAARQLALTSNPAGVQALVKILSDKNPRAACVAAYALGSSKDPRAIKALAAVLANRKHPTYKAVVDTMATYGDSSTLIKLMQSRDDYAVGSVIGSLRSGRDTVPSKYLIPFLKNPKFREDAAIILARQKEVVALDTLVDLYIKSDMYGNDEIHSALSGYGQLANDRMLPKLADKNAAVRKAAARFFETAKEPRSVDPLMTMMRDGNPRLRLEAMFALLAQRDSRALPCYITALKDSDPEVRKWACCAVALQPDPSAAETLAALLKSPDAFTSVCAAVALGQLGDRRGADLIVNYLNGKEQLDEMPSLRVPAIRAAINLKDNRVLKPIVLSLGDDVKDSTFDPGTEEDLNSSRTAKLGALKSITGQDFGYAFYRWMAWWVAQGNTPPSLMGDEEEPESTSDEY